MHGWHTGLLLILRNIKLTEFWKALALELLQQEKYEDSTPKSKRHKGMTESPGHLLQAIPLYNSWNIKSQAFKPNKSPKSRYEQLMCK